MNPTTAHPIRLVRPNDGLVAPGPGQVTDRFMIDGPDSDQRFALVQHLLAPRALAAPVHRHHLEDEYTYVLTGRVGVMLGEEEVVIEPGDLLFKPRNQWHTFWNAGDKPATVLELISPAGLETFFRWLAELDEFPDPDVLAVKAAPYQCDVDQGATEALMIKLGIAD